MVHRLRLILLQSLRASPETLKLAINNVWPRADEDVSRYYSEPEFLESPYDWWIQSTVHATLQTKQQTVHYHLLEGHLLVDGQPLGKLPAKHRESVILEHLFGKQNLLTYPSGLRGMTYMLALRMGGHQIHLGFRDQNLVVQACFEGNVLEFIPRNVFGNQSNFDLPASLVENCIHWLDLVLHNPETGSAETLPMFPEVNSVWRASVSNVVWPSTYFVRSHAGRSERFQIDVMTVPRIGPGPAQGAGRAQADGRSPGRAGIDPRRPLATAR